MRYIPGWFPGAGWKAFAQKGRKLAYEMVNVPYDMTVKAMVSSLNRKLYAPSTETLVRNREIMNHPSRHLI